METDQPKAPLKERLAAAKDIQELAQIAAGEFERNSTNPEYYHAIANEALRLKNPLMAMNYLHLAGSAALSEKQSGMTNSMAESADQIKTASHMVRLSFEEFPQRMGGIGEKIQDASERMHQSASAFTQTSEELTRALNRSLPEAAQEITQASYRMQQRG